MKDLRKKTWLLDQRLIDLARKHYRTKTEKEAVTKALEDVVTDEKIDKALRKTAGKLPDFERGL